MKGNSFVHIMAAFIVCLVAGSSCRAFAQSADGPVHVLFIGNSYTFYNRMPRMVVAMGDDLGYDIRVETAVRGGASFADHRRRAETLRAIDSRPWDIVVMQNYSLAPGLPPDEVRRRSLPDARSLVARIRRNRADTRIVWFQTWGRRDGDRLHCLRHPRVCTFGGHTLALVEGYRIYRDALGGDIAPVGTLWRRSVRDDDRPFDIHALWASDGSHPSRLGSYLTAAIILRTIVDAPVSPSRYTAGLPEGTARYLRGIADAT